MEFSGFQWNSSGFWWNSMEFHWNPPNPPSSLLLYVFLSFADVVIWRLALGILALGFPRPWQPEIYEMRHPYQSRPTASSTASLTISSVLTTSIVPIAPAPTRSKSPSMWIIMGG